MGTNGNTKLVPKQYTVVQHSGVTNGHSEFVRGLESKSLLTVAELRLVEEAGGKLFDSYGEAEEWAEREQFPDSAGFSLIPKAPGTFSPIKVGGLAVYVPKGDPAAE